VKECKVGDEREFICAIPLWEREREREHVREEEDAEDINR